ncbi:MAG: hypothetical protein ACXABG_13540 [Promethearchaeota archaeon]|jgi:hypothetical protein
MKINENKFPFKWMSRVIKAFDGIEKGRSSFQIARTIGSCGPDASEVLKMLAYVTSFGKVVESNGKWKTIHSPLNPYQNQSGFRYNYIEGLDQLIKELSGDFISIEELSSLNGRDTQEILSELTFLSQITEKGRVILEQKRFPQKFAFKPWNQQ